MQYEYLIFRSILKAICFNKDKANAQFEKKEFYFQSFL